jgi:hypothetical protein
MIVDVDFIPGISVGIELYLGEDLVDNDKFACTIDLFILRITIVIPGD